MNLCSSIIRDICYNTKWQHPTVLTFDNWILIEIEFPLQFMIYVHGSRVRSEEINKAANWTIDNCHFCVVT